MTNPNRKARVPWVAVGVVLLGLYVGAYFVLPQSLTAYETRYYSFPSRWIAKAYRPIAWTEAKLTRRPVCIGWDRDWERSIEAMRADPPDTFEP
jgi:hypothetical protein